MTASDHVPGYVPNPNYSQEDWDDVHSPEATDEQLAQMRPAVEVMPELVEAMRRRRGPQREPTKAQLTLRLDREVIDGFRVTGPGWQSRMNDVLRMVLDTVQPFWIVSPQNEEQEIYLREVLGDRVRDHLPPNPILRVRSVATEEDATMARMGDVPVTRYPPVKDAA